MFVIIAKFRIATDKRAAFAALVDKQAVNSVKLEPDCQYFDVCQDEADPDLFVLYEIYTDAKAFDTHRTYPHYKEFQAAIAAMVSDRQVMRLVRREPPK
jgi:quinol monooxygenase YgiN